MVIFLPLFLTLMVLGMLRGGTNMVLLLPMLLMLGAGAIAVTIAMRDGRRRRDRSIPVLPDNPLSRRMRATLRPKRTKRSAAPEPRDLASRRSRGHRPWGRPGNPRWPR